MSDALNRSLAFLDADGPRVHALLVRLTLSEEVAEDLMQDLFMRLSQSKEFANSENAAAYAFRSAVHLAFDWRRSQKRANFRNLEGQQAPVDSTDSPLTGLVRREQFEEVLQALDRLSGDSREIIVARYLLHQSYEEIAERLDKTAKQVRGLHHKAVIRLRELLRVAPPSQCELGS